MKTLSRALVLCLFCSILAAQEIKNDQEVVTTGNNSKIKFSSLVQIWNTTNFKNNDVGNQTFNTFRIRRVETKFSGAISDRVSYTAMFDLAKLLKSSLTDPDSAKGKIDKADSKQSAYAILQDVSITYSVNKENKIDLQVGQFKYPLTYEGLQSSAGLGFVERAEMTRTFGDKRDLGFQVSAKPGKMFEAALMLAQGNSQNKTDANTSKDFAGRIVVKPIEGLSVGGSFYKGYSGDGGKIPMDRWAAEAAYKKDAITAYGELIVAKESKSGVAESQKGAYAAFLYKLNDQWQPGIRYEYAWKSLETVKKIPQNRLTLGVNYFVEKNAKIQLNYVYCKFSRDNGDTASNTVFVNWQVNF